MLEELTDHLRDTLSATGVDRWVVCLLTDGRHDSLGERLRRLLKIQHFNSSSVPRQTPRHVDLLFIVFLERKKKKGPPEGC